MKQSIFQALSERSFLMLWLGEVATQIAFNLFNFFLVLHVFTLTHSNIAVAGIVLSFTLPSVLFGIVAGAYVDRWGKKRTLFFTNVSRAILLLLLVFVHTNLFLIFLISFVVSIITQFFIPAETPMIPLAVKREHLLSANALFGIGIYASIFIAYIASGPLLILFGKVTTLFIVAGLFLIGAIFIHFIDDQGERKSRLVQQGKVVVDIKNVFATVLSRKPVYQAVFLLALSQVIILIIAVITPGYATDVLKMRVEDFPLTFIAPAAFGVLVGAALIVNLFHSMRKDILVNTGLLLAGTTMLMMSYGSTIISRALIAVVNHVVTIATITPLHILTFLAFILGVANSMIFVPSNTTLQEETLDTSRGKVYGVLNTMVGVISFFPIVIVGGLSDIVGVGRVIAGVGGILILTGGIRFFLAR